jgi:hypothetical protein
MLTFEIIKTHESIIYDRTNIKDRINQEIYEFIDNKWLDGILIEIIKIDMQRIDLDTKFHYIIGYKEIIDENYLLEKQRLEIGL